MYLDTEIEEFTYKTLAKQFVESKFTITEISDINTYEVFPTLKYNLRSVTGAWAGFDKESLIKECTKNYNRRNNWLFRLNNRIAKKLLWGVIKDDWQKVVNLTMQI